MAFVATHGGSVDVIASAHLGCATIVWSSLHTPSLSQSSGRRSSCCASQS